ncbi:MAG: GH25 family lysozyme, partial [Eubacterium sp.]
MKRLLSLLLSAVMFICATLGTCLSVYAGEPVFGIDVSEHNDLVNFADAKNNNKDFVMIRLGYYNHLDEKFWDNVKNAYNAKMDFGVYLYSYAYSTAEAQIEANFVVDTLSQMGNY